MAAVFTVVSGTIPPGWAIDENTGYLSGTATTPGTYIFTVGVTEDGRYGETILRITVIECPDESSSSVASSAASSAASSVASSSSSSSIASLGRFTVSEEYEGADVNPARSHIDNGTLAIDEAGGDATNATCVFTSSSSVTPNYASLILSLPPEPIGTVVTATIHIIVEYDPGVKAGVDAGGILENAVYNIRNTQMPNQAPSATGRIASIVSGGGGTAIAKAEFTITFNASEWATYFSSTAANVFLRFGQWDTGNYSLSTSAQLFVYDAWIEYTY